MGTGPQFLRAGLPHARLRYRGVSTGWRSTTFLHLRIAGIFRTSRFHPTNSSTIQPRPHRTNFRRTRTGKFRVLRRRFATFLFTRFQRTRFRITVRGFYTSFRGAWHRFSWSAARTMSGQMKRLRSWPGCTGARPNWPVAQVGRYNKRLK